MDRQRTAGDRLTTVWSQLGRRAHAIIQLPVRSGHLSLLDGWRGLCILLVLVGHFIPRLDRLAWIGVEFFFVLSGRLMADILIFKRQPVGTFLKRRMARVLPALAVYVFLAAVLVNLALVASGQSPRLASPLAALFFFHNYLPFDRVVSAFEHTWSLAVEEHSYLVLVVIALLAARKPRLSAAIALLVGAAAVANGIRLAALPHPGAQDLVWRSDVRVSSVLLSFALLVLVRLSGKRIFRPRFSWVAPLAAALSIGAVFVLNPKDPAQLAVCTILAAVGVNMLESSGEWVRRLLRHPFLLWAGTLSFSLYLWQQLFYVFTHYGLPSPVALGGTVVCALWSFKRIEDPARNYLNQRWARVPVSSTPLPPLIGPARRRRTVAASRPPRDPVSLF